MNEAITKLPEILYPILKSPGDVEHGQFARWWCFIQKAAKFEIQLYFEYTYRFQKQNSIVSYYCPPPPKTNVNVHSISQSSIRPIFASTHYYAESPQTLVLVLYKNILKCCWTSQRGDAVYRLHTHTQERGNAIIIT